MAYNAKVGSFNIDTAKTVGQNQAITDVGFQPKIVLFWWGGSTGTSDGIAGGNIAPGFGAAIDSTHRFEICGASTDAAATSDTMVNSRTDDVIRVYSAGNTGAIDGEMDFVSMDVGGFTLIVNDQFTNAYRISYLALGGTDLTNVYIGNKQLPASTGNFDTTGVGFQPDAIITAGIRNTTLDTAAANMYMFLGMATGASNEGVVFAFLSDASDTSATRGYGYNGETLNEGGSTGRSEFITFIADGFTLNNLEGTVQYYFHYIALKGGQYKVHELTTRTDGNDIAESDVGFQPVALLFASANRALSTQDTVTNDARLSIGAATSASERACAAISDENGLADTETAYANYDSAVYAHVVDDAIAGLMDIKSIDAGGFTCVMDDTDPSACWVTYLAIGAEAEEGCVNVVTTIESASTTIPIVVVDWCEP